MDLWKIADIYDDLGSLGEWYTRQLSAVRGYLGQFPVRERIENKEELPEEFNGAIKVTNQPRLGTRNLGIQEEEDD